MKQGIIMFLCLIIIVGGGIAEIKYLENTSNYLNSDINYIDNMIENENYEEALNHIEIVDNNWDNTELIWNIFLINDELDDFTETLTELKEYIKYENEEECKIAVEKLKAYSELVVRRQKIRVDNIL